MAAASPAKRTRYAYLNVTDGSTLALPDVLAYVLPYLSIRDAAAIKSVSRTLKAAAASHTAEHLAIVKSSLTSFGPSARVFETYGRGLLQLSVSKIFVE
jgi:hypothetical protein